MNGTKKQETLNCCNEMNYKTKMYRESKTIQVLSRDSENSAIIEIVPRGAVNQNGDILTR